MAVEQAPRILVAEDDAAIRRLLAATLRRRRLDVHLVEDGQQAREALQSSRWDVAVFDLMMPNVTGWELVDWLAENQEHRPRTLIIMSAADRELLRSLNPAVVNAIIFKPFDVQEVGGYVSSAARIGRADRRHKRVLRTV